MAGNDADPAAAARLTARAVGLALMAACAPVFAWSAPLGANLERFAYPYPVRWYETSSQGKPVRMAYMDVPPQGIPNGRSVVLLHGKNFCGATWEGSAKALAARGYRVIIPDQVGFCKSTKPAGYQYSFHALAGLTHGLLAQIGVVRPLMVGHSTGGMLAIRYVLDYPTEVARLVLVNPLGLNDTLALGVPYSDLGDLRSEEDKTDAVSIKAYELKNYYHDEWRPAYDRWVDMLAGEYEDDGGVVREAQARTSDMIQTQPVAAELGRVQAPVSLIIGQEDRTAFRSDKAPSALRAQVQAVPLAAEGTVRRFPNGRLVRLSGLGHAPQVEDPQRFNRALLAELAR